MLLAIAIAGAGESEVCLTNIPGPRYASASAAVVGGLVLAWRRRSPLTITLVVLRGGQRLLNELFAEVAPPHLVAGPNT